jgi:hypothetical protein
MVRRVLEGKKRYVLHLQKSLFTEGLSPETKPSKPSTDPPHLDQTAQASAHPAEEPSTAEDSSANPASDPAPETHTKSNGYNQNAGNAGFSANGEGCHEPHYCGDEVKREKGG